MATYTPNYNLKKPADADSYDIADANGNMDIIDGTLGTLNNQIANKFTTDVLSYDGALTSGQEIVLDNTKNYMNAAAITVLQQANSNDSISGNIRVTNSGSLTFIPNVTSSASRIRVKVLWMS